jgi:hypothetical protein
VARTNVAQIIQGLGRTQKRLSTAGNHLLQIIFKLVF